jgi:putative ABC transport system ATP-binding protein
MFNLLPYLNALENILLSCELNPARRRNLKDTSVKKAAQSILENLGIQHLIERPVTELSVGQQQRIAAARALLGAPELLIADEPTSALDSDHREKFLQLLFNEADRQGSTVIFVSHDRSLEGLFHRSVHLLELNRV